MTVTVRELRRGTPRVLLLHGLEDSWTSWRTPAAGLPPDWGLVALDLPWRAGNDYAWRRAADPAGWLRNGLDQLDGAVDATIAHSFGATAALSLMAAGERRLGSAAVLISPLYRPPDAPVTWDLLDRSRTSFVRNVRDGVSVRLGDRAIDPDVREGVLAKAVERVGPRALLATFDEFVASTDLPLHAITQRTLILTGAADAVLSDRAASALAERVPGARLCARDGFDHYCHLRRPAPVARLAADYIGGSVRPEVIPNEGSVT